MLELHFHDFFFLHKGCLWAEWVWLEVFRVQKLWRELSHMFSAAISTFDMTCLMLYIYNQHFTPFVHHIFTVHSGIAFTMSFMLPSRTADFWCLNIHSWVCIMVVTLAFKTDIAWCCNFLAVNIELLSNLNRSNVNN